MALVLADRVNETTTTAGTGTVTLAGAVNGYQSFSAIGNGNTTYYTISHQTANEWEVGIGTYTSSGTTLSRDTVLASSNSGSLVNFSAGTKNVFADYPAGKAIYKDASGNSIALGTPASVTLTNATGLPLSTGVTGTLPIASGGTNTTTTPTAGAVAYGTGSAYAFTAAGTSNQVLISNGASAPSWSNLSSLGVSSFSAGTTGFTPSTATTGAVTLAGTLATTNGGTGLTSFTANGVLYASSSSALTTGSTLTFDGTNLQAAGALRSAAATAQVQLISGSNVAGTTSFDLIQAGFDAYVYNRANGPLLFGVNNTERARIDSSGNFGIGTSSPAQKLDVVGNAQVSGFGKFGNALSFIGKASDLVSGGSATDSAIRYDGNNLVFSYGITEKMRLDSSGNLGIGTSSPFSKLTVSRGGSAGAVSNFTDGLAQGLVLTTGTGYFGFYNPNYGAITFRDGGNAVENMRLTDSGNLGLGVTPTNNTLGTTFQDKYAVLVADGSTPRFWLGSNWYYNSGDKFLDNGYSSLYGQQSGGHLWWVNATNNSSGAGATNAFTQAMTLDSSGNLGLGVTPSAWLSGYAPVFENRGGSVVAPNTTQLQLFANAYLNSSTQWIRRNAGYAAYYNLGAGAHEWHIAGTSTAGSTISWTQAMTLDASGNLGIGTTSPGAKLDVSVGSGTSYAIRATSADASTNARFTARPYNGTSGVFDFRKQSDDSVLSQIYVTNGATPDLNILNSQGYAITFGTNNAEKMRLDSSGNLGIGTSSPAKKLDVNGDALINGLTVGRGSGNVSGNTAFGYQAAYTNATGTRISAVGYQAAYSTNTTGFVAAFGYQAAYTNSTGYDLVAIGNSALYSNTSGTSNAAVGGNALYSSTTGSGNVALGYNAGYYNTTGSYMTAVGYYALYNTTGLYNTGVGGYALYSNTSGTQNTAIGGIDGSYAALHSNTTGSYNVALGNGSLAKNTTASNNTAVGFQAGYNNTTGVVNCYFGGSAGYSNSTGSSNTGFGFYSLQANTASENSGFGYYTLAGNTSGTANTALGSYALRNNTTASQNTAVGYLAGYNNTTGGYSTAIGYQALYSNTTANNNHAFGWQSGYSLNGGNSNLLVGLQSGYALTSGSQNTFVGAFNAGPGNGAGSAITTGSKNTILGAYSGNQGGLDIRTASNYIVLSDGDGNPRQIIDSSGNLGLGVTPSAWGSNFRALQIADGVSLIGRTGISRQDLLSLMSNAYFNGTNYIYIGSRNAAMYSHDNGQHQWFTAPSGTAGNAISFTQAMTLDASGHQLVGYTSSVGTAYQPNIQVKGSSSSNYGAYGIISSNNEMLGFMGVWSNGENSLWISADPDNLRASSSIVFSTDGTERARIDSSGNLLVGTTNNALGATDGVIIGPVESSWTVSNSGNVPIRVYNKGSSGTRYCMEFRSSSTAVGSITHDGTNTAYNTSSDRRLKENIVLADDAGSVVDSIQIVKHDWKSGGHARFGVIAQDLHVVAPEAVKVGDDNEEVSDPWGVDYSKLVPMLIKELQSLRARVAQLESKGA